MPARVSHHWRPTPSLCKQTNDRGCDTSKLTIVPLSLLAPYVPFVWEAPIDRLPIPVVVVRSLFVLSSLPMRCFFRISLERLTSDCVVVVANRKWDVRIMNYLRVMRLSRLVPLRFVTFTHLFRLMIVRICSPVRGVSSAPPLNRSTRLCSRTQSVSEVLHSMLDLLPFSHVRARCFRLPGLPQRDQRVGYDPFFQNPTTKLTLFCPILVGSTCFRIWIWNHHCLNSLDVCPYRPTPGSRGSCLSVVSC